MHVSFETIGTIHSPYSQQEGTPIQPSTAGQSRGVVELMPDYVEALQDLEGFERIWLVFLLDRARPWQPKVIPYRDDEPRGLFATRAPSRPCPIGLSVVKVEAIHGARVEVLGLDILDGTPLLDIKPYVPEFDAWPESRAGWLEGSGERRSQADPRFSIEESAP